MDIYKASNLVISPKRKVYRRGKRRRKNSRKRRRMRKKKKKKFQSFHRAVPFMVKSDWYYLNRKYPPHTHTHTHTLSHLHSDKQSAPTYCRIVRGQGVTSQPVSHRRSHHSVPWQPPCSRHITTGAAIWICVVLGVRVENHSQSS